MPFGFETVKTEDDSAKQKCVCTNCFQKLSAYTVELLTEKELRHKCRTVPLCVPLVGNQSKRLR